MSRTWSIRNSATSAQISGRISLGAMLRTMRAAGKTASVTARWLNSGGASGCSWRVSASAMRIAIE